MTTPPPAPPVVAPVAVVAPSPPASSIVQSPAPKRRAWVWGVVAASMAVVSAAIIVGVAVGTLPRDPVPHAVIVF